MKKLVDDPRLIYKCCDLYYRQEKSQQEICDLSAYPGLPYRGC